VNRSARAGQKVLRLQGAMPMETVLNQTLCADMHGFNVVATVRCDAEDRRSMEKSPCRSITRPALLNEWVQCNVAVQVVLKQKTPWRRDCTTSLAISPLGFMKRLAAQMTWPRQRQPMTASRLAISAVG